MEEVIYYSSLFDYYKELLSLKEKNYFKDYYFDNLSLQEIADNYNISKNAVSKSIKNTKNKLDKYEKALKLFANKEKIKRALSNEDFIKIEKYI